MTTPELTKWLRENSSGVYRPAAEAADLIDRLVSELETNTQEIDSYGEPGSDFRICSYCQAESGAGMLDKGIPHDADCILANATAQTPPDSGTKNHG
jgi:hypothetical protein